MATLGAAVILAELLLSALAPIYRTQITDEELTIGYPRAVNLDDYRGELRNKNKAPGELRVLAMGDSVTFGVGVGAEQTWSRELERQLQKGRATPVTVLNAGVEGASLADLTYSFKKKWQAYTADVVVLAATGNMVSLAVAHHGERPILPAEHFAPLRQPRPFRQRLFARLNRGVHSLCLPSFLSLRSQQAFYWLGVLNHNLDPSSPYGALLAHGYRQADLDPRLSATGWSLFGAELARLQALVQDRGKRLLMVYITPRFSLSEAFGDNEKNVPKDRLSVDPSAVAAATATGLGIPFIDGGEALRQARRNGSSDLYLLLDYAHLAPGGHAAIAAAVAAALGP